MQLLLAPLLLALQSDVDDDAKWGHSRHGAAYDQGPRTRPWKMDGVGEVHFPVTTTVPEVQAWFDQGMALLHGFWYFEAERSFRWCLKLDPECAMAYWALSRCVKGDDERSAAFLAEAVARKDVVSARERGFIEVQEAIAALDEAKEGDAEDDAREELRVILDTLLMEHPDDVEAKALHWLTARDVEQGEAGRYGREAVLDDILDLDPDHVGALHYRIHNWDGEEGRFAIDSCVTLTEVAPNCGHLQHMPGHVLSGIGMWHEAAIAMDSATRVEKAYMHERRVLPEDNWDYVHNLDYLAYIQEQLGMYEAATQSVDQLLIAPPPTNVPGEFKAFAPMMVRLPALRNLLRRGQWQAVLDGDRLAWGDMLPPPLQAVRAYAETRAMIGLGDLEAATARLAELEDVLAMLAEGFGEGGPGGAMDGDVGDFATAMMRAPVLELSGLLAMRNGELLRGIGLLTEAAETLEEGWMNDPPPFPSFGFNTLGSELLAVGSHALAAEAFERTLETVFHDGEALAGLVQAYHATGEAELASAAMAALEVVWSDADAGNRHLAAARATGVRAATGELPERFRQAMDQRSYRRTVLDVHGPSLYAPAPAPELAALDAAGERVRLADYAGRNVLLVFYLGDGCLHCMEQIQGLEERAEALAELGTDVLAISKDSVEKIAGYQADYRLTLLSDTDFANARRFGSYDDFEELELHSTLLIDAEGRIHWARTGGEPFMDFDFIESEAARLAEGGLVRELAVAQG